MNSKGSDSNFESEPLNGSSSVAERIQALNNSHNNKARPPPTAPPPPPYPRTASPYSTSPTSTGRIATMQHIYESVEPQSEHVWPFRTALAQLVLGILGLIAAGVCADQTAQYCPYYTGCWVCPLYIVTSFVGITAAARTRSERLPGDRVGNRLFVANLMCSVLCCVASVILCAFSVSNWLHIGLEPGLPCVISEYVPRHIQRVYEKMGQFDYWQCVFRVKLGVAMNSVLCLLAIFQGLLCCVSAALCIRRLCQCRGKRYR